MALNNDVNSGLSGPGQQLIITCQLFTRVRPNQSLHIPA